MNHPVKLLSLELFTQDSEIFLNFLKFVATSPNLAIDQMHLKFYGLKVNLSDLLAVYPFTKSKNTKLTLTQLTLDVRLFPTAN
jgi:hypothetical protein